MKNLYDALKHARLSMGPVYKNARNPHFKNTYADINSVMAVIQEPLIDNDLMWFQENQDDQEGCVTIITKLLHFPSGEELKTTLRVPYANKDPQKFGSALTYGRRYALVTLFGLGTTDDDANLASGKEKTKEEKELCFWGEKEINNFKGMNDTTELDNWGAANKDMMKDLEGVDDEVYMAVKRAWAARKKELTK